MTENTDNKERSEAVSDYRVILYGEPAVQTVTPKSGINAGKEIKVLTVRAYHPVSVRKNDGTFEEKDPLWLDLKLFDNNADHIKELLKDGLVLRVSGEIKTRPWTGKDGKVRESSDLMLHSLAVDLKQRGLKGLNFEKPKAAAK